MEHIGYTPVTSENKAHRPGRSGYSWQKGLTSPPRIYSTYNRAATQSPIGAAQPVFMGNMGALSEDQQ